jgi:teichoic acid transport system permease protein
VNHRGRLAAVLTSAAPGPAGGAGDGDSPAAIALAAGLTRVGRPASLREYTGELWRRRYFAFTLAWSRFTTRNTQDRLGAAWNVLRPLLQAGIYAAVFGVILSGSSAKPDNYVEFVTAGVFVFTFLSGCLTAGSKAVVGDLGLVRTLRFPRAVLPLAAALMQFYAFLPAVGVLAVLLLALGNAPQVEWLLLPVAVVLMGAFGLGIALTCARVTVMLRDFSHLLPFVIRILFYTSGVIIDVKRIRFDGYPAVEQVLRDNPFHVYIELVRQSLLSSHDVQLGDWLWGTGWGLGAMLFGFVFFWRGEESYGR